MRSIRLAGLALLAAVLSCRDATGPRAQIAQLDAARKVWQAQELHDYALTIQRNCFCDNTRPLYVLVLSDTVAGAFDLETGAWVDRRLGLTVDGLFDFVDYAA